MFQIWNSAIFQIWNFKMIIYTLRGQCFTINFHIKLFVRLSGYYRHFSAFPQPQPFQPNGFQLFYSRNLTAAFPTAHSPQQLFPQPQPNQTHPKGVFGLAFKVLFLLKKPKAKPKAPAFFQVLLEKLFFRSSILKAP